MPIIDVKINKNNYQVACDEGQEEYLFNLAQKLNTRLENMVSNYPNVTDNKLLIMNSLMLMDELEEGTKTSKVVKDKHNKIVQEEADLAAAKAMDAVTEYVEKLAKRIEK